MMDLLSDNPKLGHNFWRTPCHCGSMSRYIARNYWNQSRRKQLKRKPF
jgi:hypothetical protein